MQREQPSEDAEHGVSPRLARVRRPPPGEPCGEPRSRRGGRPATRGPIGRWRTSSRWLEEQVAARSASSRGAGRQLGVERDGFVALVVERRLLDPLDLLARRGLRFEGGEDAALPPRR